MVRQLRRFQRTKNYQRVTLDKHGREHVKPFLKEDFDKVIRLCLVKRDSCKRTSEKYRTWYRNYILLILGVNTGNRIETLLELTPRDIAGGEYTCVEMKTHKIQQFKMNKSIYETVKAYIDLYDIGPNEFLFASRQGGEAGYPITRQRAWKMIKQLSNESNISYPVGCHSLRKSYGRWYWDATHDLLTVQKLLMHSSAEETMKYIMLEASDVHNIRTKINNTERWNGL